jgi:hypothetical protein
MELKCSRSLQKYMMLFGANAKNQTWKTHKKPRATRSLIIKPKQTQNRIQHLAQPSPRGKQACSTWNKIAHERCEKKSIMKFGAHSKDRTWKTKQSPRATRNLET